MYNVYYFAQTNNLMRHNINLQNDDTYDCNNNYNIQNLILKTKFMEI